MKKTTFKNLLFFIIFSSFVTVSYGSTILSGIDTEKENKDKNELKIKVKLDIGASSLSTSLTGSYNLPYFGPDQTITDMKVMGTLKSPVSNKPYRKIINGPTWSDKFKIAFNELFAELALKAKMSLNEHELILQLGIHKLTLDSPVKPDNAAYILAKLNKLPGGISIEGEITSHFLKSWTSISFLVGATKKSLMTEEDSIQAKTVISLGNEFYSGYATALSAVLGRIGGVSVKYKTGEKENMLKSVALSYTAPIEDTAAGGGRIVKGISPSASLDINLNGVGVIKDTLSSIWNMLPEKVQDFWINYELDSLNVNVSNMFQKSYGHAGDKQLADKFEYIITSLPLLTKTYYP